MILRTLLTLTVFCFPFTTWASEFSLPIWKEKA
ncbi:TonB-dependent receptor, partial [Vibrio cholerae]|nr:TonB-dependent receptor [Vibrio cholerae]